MKLSKYAKLVKQGGVCYVYHVANDGIWLGTGFGVYRAALPESVTAEAMPAIMDFDEKQAGKTMLQDKYCDDASGMVAVDLREDARKDIEAKRIEIAAIKRGLIATALRCSDGDLVFYDDSLLSPISDVFKNSDYVQTVVRIGVDGRRYVVVKDGFDVIAAVAPLDVIDKDFVGELEEFQTMCTVQLFRDAERAAQRARFEAAEADDQMSVEEAEAAGDED